MLVQNTTVTGATTGHVPTIAGQLSLPHTAAREAVNVKRGRCGVWTAAAYGRAHSPTRLVWLEGWRPPGTQ